MKTSFKVTWTGVAGATVLALAGFVGSAQANEMSVPGSACSATGTAAAKLNVLDYGTVFNKNTAGSLKVTCPLFAQPYWDSYVYLNFVKRTSASMSCTLHRRSWDGLSGASTTTSTSYNGSSYVFFGTYTFDYFNSVVCTLPIATGTSTSAQNGIIGTYMYQY